MTQQTKTLEELTNAIIDWRGDSLAGQKSKNIMEMEASSIMQNLLAALEASEKRVDELKDHLIANVETFEAVIDGLDEPEQDWTVGNNAICRIAIDYTKQALADAEGS